MRTARTVAMAITLFAAIALTTVRFGGEPRVRAQSGCSVSSVFGAYTFTFRGAYIGDLLANRFNLIESGRLVFDGNGNFSGSETVSNNETVTRAVQFTGRYNFNEDCTGTAVFLDSSGRTFANYDIAITNGARQIEAMESDGGTSIAGMLNQQFPPQ